MMNLLSKERKKYLAILLTGLFFATLSTQSFAELKRMSAEQKKQTVKHLSALIQSGEATKYLEASDPNIAHKSTELPVYLDSQGNPVDFGNNLFYKNGKFKIKLMFELDTDFPTLYGEARGFRDNSSEAFKEQWSAIILEHYLGTDYKKYDPELFAVTSICSMYAHVSTSEELSDLLKDPRIVKAVHAGTPSTPIKYGRDN